MHAPEPYLSAYLHVVHQAVLVSRTLARQEITPLEGDAARIRLAQIGDLQDAIHVITELLSEWERCDEAALRQDFLAAFDRKWQEQPPHGLRLIPTLLEKLPPLAPQR